MKWKSEYSQQLIVVVTYVYDQQMHILTTMLSLYHIEVLIFENI